MAIYLKVDGAQGAVTEQNHTDWIELLDLSWNMTRSIRSAVGVGQNRESTSAAVGEVTFTKFVDPASYALTKYAFVGEAKDYQIDFTRVSDGGETIFRTITLTNGIVSGLTNSGHGKDRPTEVYRINFTKIEVKDTGESAKGTQGSQNVTSYDLTTTQAS